VRRVESRVTAHWKQHNDKPTVLLTVTPELLIILDSINIFLIKNGLDTSY
jgi:hypothetical protein